MASSEQSYTNGPSSGLKLYQAFIFSVPIFFTFILLLLFYLFYLRRRRVDWASLRMRSTVQVDNDLSSAEMGLQKEVREMLPIIIYRESFSVKDTHETDRSRSNYSGVEPDVLFVLGTTKRKRNFNKYLHVAMYFTWIALTTGFPPTPLAHFVAFPSSPNPNHPTPVKIPSQK